MNLLPYVHAVVKATVALPPDIASRIIELAACFEASCDELNEPNWYAFDAMEDMVLNALDSVHGFQEELDKCAIGMYSNESILFN